MAAHLCRTEQKRGKAFICIIYAEDPAKLSRIYDDHIEVKVFNGKSSAPGN